jgi:hypothetical protein
MPREDRGHRAQLLGDLEAGGAPAGMSSYLIEEVLPAGEIVRSIVREAIETLRTVAGYAPIPLPFPVREGRSDAALADQG